MPPPPFSSHKKRIGKRKSTSTNQTIAERRNKAYQEYILVVIQNHHIPYRNTKTSRLETYSVP